MWASACPSEFRRVGNLASRSPRETPGEAWPSFRALPSPAPGLTASGPRHQSESSRSPRSPASAADRPELSGRGLGRKVTEGWTPGSFQPRLLQSAQGLCATGEISIAPSICHWEDPCSTPMPSYPAGRPPAPARTLGPPWSRQFGCLLPRTSGAPRAEPWAVPAAARLLRPPRATA